MPDTPILLKMLASFAFGSIPFAVFAMWGSGTSIRDVGSGNPGFNNVLRFSKPRAVLTLIGDMAKGFAPVMLFYSAADDPINIGWLYGLCAVFGHCYSPLLKFNGGKGIATSCGAMLGLYPLWAAAALVFFVLFRSLGSRRQWRQRGALASVATWIFFTAAMFVQFGSSHAIYALLMTIFLTWRHKSNIADLLGGQGRGVTGSPE